MAGLNATESDDTSEMTADAARPAPGSRFVSGKLVVIGMFAFGLFLTGLLFAYWDLHTRPFRPLQEAIANTIPGSSPRVLGGKHKSHLRGSVNTLRIIVKVDYNPLEASNEARRDEFARTILQLARTHHDVTQYERIELHVEYRIPERPAEFWSSIRTPAEWEAFSSQQDGRSS